MPKKTILIAFICALTSALQAAALPRGDERLRELVVFPEMNFNFNWQLNLQNNEWRIQQSIDLPTVIAKQREQLKRQPNDLKQLMQLGYWLDQNNETNESQACYDKVVQLCRQKIAANPQDGLSLTTLGAALMGSNNDEAERVLRQATLVSSNEWRCWVGLGNFLTGKNFLLLFPTNWLGEINPGQPISQKVLDYQPSAESLNRAEATSREAARCFDRAIAIAPKDSEFFLQRAGHMSMSNWQNCFFQHYRNGKSLNDDALVLNFFSLETIADLKKVSELNPKDYQCIGLAAYFEFFRAGFQHRNEDLKAKNLPDASQQSLHDAITHLENLSGNPDKTVAAGAFESLGMLNMIFENKPESLKDFRQAVALDPTRYQSWDMLEVMLIDAPDEFLATARARLKIDDSARNHMILSRIFAGSTSKWPEATTEAKIAEKMDTNNPVPPLQLFAIALKQSAETNYLSVAITNMVLAYPIIQAMPENDEKKNRLSEWALNEIIFNALTGNQDDAKETLAIFMKHRPDNKTAKALFDILN